MCGDPVSRINLAKCFLKPLLDSRLCGSKTRRQLQICSFRTKHRQCFSLANGQTIWKSWLLTVSNYSVRFCLDERGRFGTQRLHLHAFFELGGHADYSLQKR